jgi:hypothetical protein
MYHVKEVTLHYAIIKIYFSLMKPMLMTVLTTDTHVSGLLTGNRVAYADTSQGPHTFAVVARDGDGLGERSEVHFEEDLDISCRGSYNPDYDVVHLACDSTRPLAATECQLGDGASTECPTPFDLPVANFVNDLTLRVSAQDNVGNTDTDELVFLTSSCEKTPHTIHFRYILFHPTIFLFQRYNVTACTL